MIMPDEIRKVKDDITDRIADLDSAADYLDFDETERARIDRALSVILYKLDNLTVNDINFDKLNEIK